MRRFMYFLAAILWISPCYAQFDSEQSYDPETYRYMRNIGNQKTARNLMILKEVADYKIGDEKLAKEFDNLEKTQEYHQKLGRILNKLSNKKLRNSKNREVIEILDDAGNKLYNLLAD